MNAKEKLKPCPLCTKEGKRYPEGRYAGVRVRCTSQTCDLRHDPGIWIDVWQSLPRLGEEVVPTEASQPSLCYECGSPPCTDEVNGDTWWCPKCDLKKHSGYSRVEWEARNKPLADSYDLTEQLEGLKETMAMANLTRSMEVMPGSTIDIIVKMAKWMKIATGLITSHLNEE